MMRDDDLVGGPACLDGSLDERQIALIQAVVSRPCTAGRDGGRNGEEGPEKGS